MMELSEFLLQRIAEDEAVARAASPGPWHLNAEHDEVLAVDDITVCEGFALSGPQTRATTAHIARHDPAYVLAECDAKRRIVEQSHILNRHSGSKVVAPEMRWVLKTIALPYADHPNYDNSWRP